MYGFARKALLVVAGYAVTVIVAAATCLSAMIAGDIISNGYSPGYRVGDEFYVFDALCAGILVVGATAWPGFAATLLVSRWRNLRSTVYFSICGVVNAALAAILFFGVFLHETGFFRATFFGMPAVLIGGLAGGFAYAIFDRRVSYPRQRNANVSG